MKMINSNSASLRCSGTHRPRPDSEDLLDGQAVRINLVGSPDVGIPGFSLPLSFPINQNRRSSLGYEEEVELKTDRQLRVNSGGDDRGVTA